MAGPTAVGGTGSIDLGRQMHRDNWCKKELNPIAVHPCDRRPHMLCNYQHGVPTTFKFHLFLESRDYKVIINIHTVLTVTQL